jgi:hypothetical protein
MMNEWDVRIQGALSAIARTRYSFLAAMIFSVSVIVAEYNSQFSWYVNFARKVSFPQIGPGAEGEVPRFIQQEIVKDWVGTNRVSVSLLGINFGMSDAALLGSITLYIMSVWLFYSARRENRLIGSLLGAADSSDSDEVKKVVYHAVSSNLVFVTVSDDDAPIDSLTVAKDKMEVKVFPVRKTFTALLFLPFIANALVIFSDISSLLSEPFVRWPREEGQKLWEMVIDDPYQIAQVSTMLFVSAVFCAMTYNLCYNIHGFQVATGKILREFASKHVDILRAQPETQRKLFGRT